MKYKFIYLVPLISLLFVAFANPLPHVFFTLNRIVTTLFAVLGAYCVWGKKPFLSYALILVAIVFNPIIPIHLKREIWQFIDVIATVPFGMLVFIKSDR